jgi:tetratricopeptide (TPR) repeat protein/thiol-disulfide isomerase/thioredoxin
MLDFRFHSVNLGGFPLSRAEKTRRLVDLHPADPGRRNFLIRCCQGASAALLPASLRDLGFSLDTHNPSADGEFHLHPHYRSQTPLDATLLKVQSGLDDFITEKYASQIAAILAEWSASLLRSPQEVKAIERSLAAGFLGPSLHPVESRLLRPGPVVEAHQRTFARPSSLGRDAFLQELRSDLATFSKIGTAEFQVTGIDAGAWSPGASQAPRRLQTRVRFELVGTGKDFYREQRVGHWDLVWEATPSGGFYLHSWQALGETRSRSLSPVFADITAQALAGNSSYSSQLLRGTDYWRTVLDGASGIDIYGHNGVAVGDIDDDDFDDLYVCQPAGLPNRLYRNRGDGTFEDITEASGVGVLENTACALFVDIDNDGGQDLIVVRANGPLLFQNEGGGEFRQKPDAFQFATPPQGTFTGAAVADYDRDGWLDIYFCLYVYYQGADQYKYPTPYYDAQNGPPNFLMRNQRDGTFRDVTKETGLDKNNTRYSFCCGWNDYNRDGWPDLYVVNDFGRKNLYHNNGDGTFADVAAEAGVEDVGAGMGVCWLDYDNDGADDLYVANMWTAAGERVAAQDIFKKDAPERVRPLYRKHAMGNSLFRNPSGRRSSVSSVPPVVHALSSTTGDTEDHRGKPEPRADGNGFQDTTGAAGVGVGRWSWSSDAWDFDHDGFPDLYVANGMVSGPSREDLNSFFWRQVVAKSPEEAKPSHDYEQGWNAINELIRADGTWSGYERNVFYANNRDGTFSDVSGAAGLDFMEDGRAFALADFDHDGRQEVFLKNRNGPQLRILKNVMDVLPPSITFRLRGSKSNRDAIGAAITVETEAGRQTRFLQAGSGFLSQHSKDVFFGLGAARGGVRASIRWPSGVVQELRDLPADHRIWVEEGAAPSRMEPFRTQKAGPQGLKPASRAAGDGTAEAMPSRIPTTIETWLLAPVSAPEVSLPDLGGQACTLISFRGKPLLLNFWVMQSAHCQEDLALFDRVHARWAAQGLQLVTINVDDAAGAESIPAFVRERRLTFPILLGSDDVAGVYNILYRYLFDRHRDLSLPTSFLIDEAGDIVKIYQGPVNAAHIEQDFRHIPRTAAERLAKALPFPGVTDAVEFGRNYLSYGSVFFQRGYFDQAGAAFERALRDNPSSAEALYGMGSVYLNQQKTAEARETFERATKLHASYPDTLANAWNNLGLLSAREGRTEEAIAHFEQALRLSPDHLVALENLGSAYRQLKQWDEARQVFERALAVSPNDPEANYGLGMVFAQTGDTVSALEHLQRALQSRPAYPEALNNLGILYLRTQRRDEAVAKFEECIRVAPAFDQSYLNLARVYALEDAPDKARTVLIELLKQHPGHAQAEKSLVELGR